MINYAKRELEILGGTEDEAQRKINKAILEIVKTFSEQGHTNTTAIYSLNILKKLLMFKPLTALTGEDDEWDEVGGGKYQNKRCSTVFKNTNTGEVYDIEGKVFTRDGGETWFTNRDSLSPVTFPYNVPEYPEKVYLDEEVM